MRIAKLIVLLSLPLLMVPKTVRCYPNLTFHTVAFNFDVKATSAPGSTPDIFQVLVLDGQLRRYRTAAAGPIRAGLPCFAFAFRRLSHHSTTPQTQNRKISCHTL